jgi:hypothetical protein
MLRTTEDVVEIRHWAEAHGARPCRDEGSGRLVLALPGDPCAAREVGWDEFETTFLAWHDVFVYDDAPGVRRFFVGPIEEAHRFVSAFVAAAGASAPA